MKKFSIGVRLAVWYLAIFAIAQVVFGMGMWLLLRYHLYDMADDDLENQVEDLTHFINAQPADASLANLQAAVNDFYSREHAGDYLQIYAGDGQWVFRSPFMKDHEVRAPEPGLLKRGFHKDQFYKGLPLRFATEPLSVHGHRYVVQTAINVDDVADTLSSFRGYLFMIAPLLFLTAAAGGYWVSRKALAPVDAIVKSAREISGTNLQRRLETLQTGDELQRLSDTLNEMLERIEQSFRRVTQFTADASHELRTPISLVRTEAEVALRKSRGEAEYREALRHILAEAERTTTLVEELLALARTDSGREVLTFHAIDLNSMLQGIADRWKQSAVIRKIRFYTSFENESSFVLGDETALHRLVNILLENAFKFTGADGTVELCLAREGDHAIVAVRDTGIGIPKDEQKKVFERFYRVDKARSRESSGAGLGLSIAEWIVQQHQGTIGVESQPGTGATFRITLPLTSVPVPSVAAV